MLKEILISIEDLLLDPNNPRFICNLEQPAKIQDGEIEKQQENTLKRFSRNPAPEDPDFDVTNIKDLYDSMLRIGFVGIDRIVVRPIKGSHEKYLVLEGNRRIAAVKSILRDYDNSLTPLNHPTLRKDVATNMNLFKKITAMLLETEGLLDEQIEHKVAILLGIRHHGSLLEWEPLPRAFNIYTEYMEEKPAEEMFKFANKKAKAVADRLCIETTIVTKALRTYLAYLQARDRFPAVKDDHFSLIESGVQDRHLKAGYFKIDQDTFELDEQSLTKLNAVCQFETRDSNNPERTTNNKKKILQDPKQFNLLGRLVDRMQRANHPAVKAYAADLIQRVEYEDDLEMTCDKAVDDLTAFENRTKWAEAVGKLIDKQMAELKIDQYTGEGLDRGRKDELKETMQPLRKIMNI
jgi:hypothetical protein